jgi:DNA polymerase-3 subunit gamma/tau
LPGLLKKFSGAKLSYQVLARKWRSQTFAELVGQEHVVTTLLNALKSARMPHALLFTGARGVGKTSVARILAKSLRCPNAVDFVPCNQCSDCSEIAAGRAVDVIEIDGASNNGVENIRELRETVGYMPSHGKYKIYIIDEVHMLSTSAFNALLKTLEEPPPHVIFIFATTEVQKIPVTILSRCQRFDFRRIPIKKIVNHLKTIVDAENVTAESQALWLIGRESDGSMRDGQSLLDQVITFCGNNITLAQVIDVLGLTDRTLLSETLNALISRNASDCLKIIEQVFHHGYDPKQFAQDLLEHLRNLMIVKVSNVVRTSSNKGSLDFLDLPEQEIEELERVSKNLSNEDVHLMFDMTLKGVTDILRAQDPRIVLEMLLLRLSQAPRLTSIDELVKQINARDGSSLSASALSHGLGLGSGGAASSPKLAINPSQTSPQVLKAQSLKLPETVFAKKENEPAPTSTLSPEAKWSLLIEKIKLEKPMLGAKLEYAALQSLDDKKIMICFKKEQEFFYNQVSQKEVISQMKEMVNKYWGLKLDVDVKLRDVVASSSTAALAPEPVSPKEAREAIADEEDRVMREKVDQHPLIKEIKTVLNGKISSIKESL